jgi:predicted lipoprotein with Yx(FWY)xxD motif
VGSAVQRAGQGLIVATAAVAALTGCAGIDHRTASVSRTGPVVHVTAQPDSESGTAASVTDLTLAAAHGRVVDAAGHVLYVFSRDRSGHSACYRECASRWHPVLVASMKPRAGSGMAQQDVGSTARTDGSFQVTYRGRPLYYRDTATSPRVRDFGGVWSRTRAIPVAAADD